MMTSAAIMKVMYTLFTWAYISNFTAVSCRRFAIFLLLGYISTLRLFAKSYYCPLSEGGPMLILYHYLGLAWILQGDATRGKRVADGLMGGVAV